MQLEEINALNSKRTQDDIDFSSIHKKMKNISPVKMTSSRRSVSAVTLKKLRVRPTTPLLLISIDNVLVGS